MSIAELYGKLSPETAHDRMENLLTSDAFGTMYYIGWHDGFRNWLLEAQPVGSNTQTMQQFLGISSIQHVELAFWPNLPNGREPDVALLFVSDDGTARVLIVEVKYESGMSDFQIERQEGVPEDLTGSQLVDQMVGFAKAPDQRALVEGWFTHYGGQFPQHLDFAHLLITKDRTLPKHVYKEASEHLPAAGMSSFPCPVFWLSWRALARNLEPYSHLQDTVVARLMADLVALLERKEITDKPFEAFHELAWTGSVPCQGFWQGSGFFNPEDYERVSLPKSGVEFTCILLSKPAPGGFWQRVSLFNDRDYSILAPPKTARGLANLFWRERL
jgi:hypothetical protein